jgi:hypothetical protein
MGRAVHCMMQLRRYILLQYSEIRGIHEENFALNSVVLELLSSTKEMSHIADWQVITIRSLGSACKTCLMICYLSADSIYTWQSLCISQRVSWRDRRLRSRLAAHIDYTVTNSSLSRSRTQVETADPLN